MKRYIPNILTAMRILLSALLLFLPPRTPIYLALYLFCGSTDILDGFFARKLHAASKLGAALDSFADFFMIIAVGIGMIPMLTFPRLFYYLLGCICLLKSCVAMIGYVRFKKIASFHTILNKVMGAVIFIGFAVLQLTVLPNWLLYLFCGCAVLAALEELWIVCLAKSYDSNISSVFQLKNSTKNIRR